MGVLPLTQFKPPLIQVDYVSISVSFLIGFLVAMLFFARDKRKEPEVFG